MKVGLLISGVYVCLNLAFLTQSAQAQDECGTACPVCTGELKIDKTKDNKAHQVIPHGKFSWFSIFVPNAHGEEKEKGSTTFSIGLFNRLEGGVTLGIDSWDLRGKIKVLLVKEKRILPGLVAGVGNIKPSGLETNSYVTLSKSFNSGLPLPLSVYLGGAKPFNGEETEVIFGFAIGIGNRAGAMSAYDGKEFHSGGAFQPLNNLSTGILWVGMENLGFITSVNGRLPFIKPELEIPAQTIPNK